ncbi:DUF1684 domain-containing protein [Paenibacillus sp. M1]|uniref:DUF1684 domain-containing protein n=1 Tax=Paenibacillus haidiansis TaxID=1574488 RepID=A0ABU7VVS6_9BACL
MTDIETWREERRRSVTDFQGDLALTGLYTIYEPMRIEGVPGLWSPKPAGEQGLTLTAEPEDGITLDGQPVHGAVSLEPDHTVVRFSKAVTAVATTQPGSDHLLAVYDAEAEAIRLFEGIANFPYNPDWVIEGEFVGNDEERTVAFAHVDDEEGKLRYHQSPGDIAFTWGGAAYKMTPFVSAGSLILVFADATNGQTTYKLGRMLVVTRGENGKAVLDFNKSFLPPCAFSPHFNCPFPPRQNRLPFEVKAGEQQVLTRE